MLESLIFMFLIFFGGLCILYSIIALLIGIFKKSRKIILISFGIGCVPVLCYGLIIFWYKIAIPWFNKGLMEDFSGIHITHSYGKEITKDSLRLTLNSDGTYKFDELQYLKLKKNGTWKTGGVDGVFEFYNENENIIEFATPLQDYKNEIIIFNDYDSVEVKFIKIRNE